MSDFNPNSVRQSMASAANEPTKFPAKERGIYVSEMIKKIETMLASGSTMNEIRTEMKDFIVSYPRIFEMVTRASYDKSQLRTMLAMLDKMGAGQLSQHQASMIVGQKVYDTYAAPSVRNATTRAPNSS